ncbi:MAG: GrpB family protein [Armatimonadetes bacterium]|nr:GrpB family protein [Armatimonadota bacterium]
MTYWLRRPIVIADYDPQWPVLYEQERDRLAEALGAFARRIEHIGSTSVPGLPAKSIIDSIGAAISHAPSRAVLRRPSRAPTT